MAAVILCRGRSQGGGQFKDTYDWICGIAQEQNREGGLNRIRFVLWIVIPIHGEAFVLDIEAIASKDEAHIDIREIRHVRQFLEF